MSISIANLVSAQQALQAAQLAEEAAQSTLAAADREVAAAADECAEVARLETGVVSAAASAIREGRPIPTARDFVSRKTQADGHRALAEEARGVLTAELAAAREVREAAERAVDDAASEVLRDEADDLARRAADALDVVHNARRALAAIDSIGVRFRPDTRSIYQMIGALGRTGPQIAGSASQAYAQAWSAHRLALRQDADAAPPSGQA